MELENGLANTVRSSKVRPTEMISLTPWHPSNPHNTRRTVLTVEVRRSRPSSAIRPPDRQPTWRPRLIHDTGNPPPGSLLGAGSGAKSTECATAKRGKRSAVGRTSGSHSALPYRGSRGTRPARTRGMGSEFDCHRHPRRHLPATTPTGVSSRLLTWKALQMSLYRVYDHMAVSGSHQMWGFREILASSVRFWRVWLSSIGTIDRFLFVCEVICNWQGAKG